MTLHEMISDPNPALRALLGIEISKGDKFCNNCQTLIDYNKLYVTDEVTTNIGQPLHYPQCAKLTWKPL